MKINDKESVRGKRHIETLAARKASGSWRNGVPVVPELCCTTNRSQTPGLTPGLIEFAARASAVVAQLSADLE